MSIISKQDTNGVKPLLLTGELGYDNYAAGGDRGRVFIGTGTENIGLAKKSEVMAIDSKADVHIARVDNPHGVTKAQVGLGNVDNTADNVKNVLSATKWTAARTITLSGDIAGSASVDGLADVTIATTVQPKSVTLGTDTVGNYVAGATAGTGISISGTAGEGWSPTITNTAPNVTTNLTTTHNATDVVVNSSDGTDGTINGATQTLAGVMTATDKVKLDGIATGATANTGTVTSIATSGAITGGTITSTGTISHSTADGYLHVPATGTTNNGKVLTAGATAGSLSWTALPSAPVTSVAGKTGVVTLGKNDVGLGNVDNTADASKNVLSATKLATPRTINGVAFDGTANITVSDSTAVKLTGNQTIEGVKTFSSTINGGITGACVNYGIGTQTLLTETNLNNCLTGGKFITPQNGLTNLPTDWSQGRYVIDVSGGSSYASQLLTDPWNGNTAIRVYNGTVWTEWKRLVTKDYADTKVAKVTSTDNAIVRFNGTTGEVQNSGVVIDDNGIINCVASTDSTAINIKGRSSDNSAGIYFYSNDGAESLGSIAKAMTQNLNRLVLDSSGTDAYFDFRLNNVTKAVLEPSGGFLLKSGTGALGYGTGAGGTVTQLTSKSTAVTLNKPCGVIIMNNAALAAGATVSFVLYNSLYVTADYVAVHLPTLGANYSVTYKGSATGQIVIYLTNTSTTSLSDSIRIQFSIIKGSNV